MKVPLDKLLSIPGNKYEFNVGAIKLIEKVGGRVIDDINFESWKIVPTVLKSMLDGKFHYYYPEEKKSEVKEEPVEGSDPSSEEETKED